MKVDRQLCERGRTCILRSFILFLILLTGISPAGVHAAQAGSAAVLGKTELPAYGRQETILTIAKFGRYAVTAKSEQGTGLQLIDRMAGPGEISGASGERDGRLDLFLERGDYKIVTHGHEKASGTVHVEARPFSEKNAPQPPALIDFKLIEAELKDFEQTSSWLEIKERRRVVLEAAGRSLADLRLWKDGAWLVDAAPVTTTVQPRTGQPLRVCRLVVDLEPGLYLLSAYGGAALAWAEDNGKHPFYLRSGIPELGTVTRKRFTIGPFGTDRFIVPGSSTYFRAELAEARDLSLQAGWFDPGDPFGNNGQVKTIQKNSSPPAVEIFTAANKGSKHIVTVTGEAGMAYVFQHFESNSFYTFQGTGEYWISSVHSGHPQDSVDATALLVSGNDTYRTRPLNEQTVVLNQRTGYSRRANLLDILTLFLRIDEQGPYQVMAQGVEARFRIEPFLTARPSNYTTPKFQAAGSTWDLDAGYYVLTVQPEKKGIMDLIIRPSSWVSWIWGKLDATKGEPAPSVRAAVRFSNVSLNRDQWYTLHLNHQPEVRTGLVVRSLPLDLADPLPVTQRPDETVSVPFAAAEAGTLRAEADDGSLLDLSVDNGPWQKTHSVTAGRHIVAIRSSSKDTIIYALALEPDRLSAGAQLPPVSQAALDSLPKFPVLTDTNPRYFDLDRNSSSTFHIQANRSALYQIQSTGLLSTEGVLRSRTAPRFVREAENGKGRNFFMRQYLHEGDYQITVSSRGRSKGHLGLTMERSGLIQAGSLASRAPARISLAAGTSAVYQFKITKAGEYRVRAAGLGRKLKCRLEDKDGWPLIAPNSDADIMRRFDKGTYRLIILPESTDAKIVTTIDPAPRPRRFKGHGPHEVPLAVSVDHTWREPAAGKARRPDQWTFVLPAAGNVAIELTGEMQGDLLRLAPDGSQSRVALIPPVRGWQGPLEAGRYRIDAVSLRVNNQAPYRVAVRPGPLMAGMSREVTLPADIPVAIGQQGLIEISSIGGVDVKARLTTDNGALVAENDDRPDDWNFQIAASLKPGNYRLHVDSLGGGEGACSVSVSAPKEEEKKALLIPASTKVTLADKVHLYPLSLPARGELLMLSARAPENIGMSVEAWDQEAWRTIGSTAGRNALLETPLREPGSQIANARYRLRLWSMDRRNTAVELSAQLVSPRQFGEEDLKKGVELSVADGAKTSVASAVVRIDRGGLLRIPGEHQRLRWSAGVLRSCAKPEQYLPVQTGYVWITGETSKGAPQPARAERMGLASGEDKAIQFRLPGRDKVLCDLAGDPRGPVVVTASSRVGRPAVELVDRARLDPVNTDRIVVSEHGSVSISLKPKDPVAKLWAASPADEPFEVQLQHIAFSAPEPAFTKDGLQGSIVGKKARVYDLPRGRKHLRLSLGETIAAALVKDDRIISVHWSEGNAFTESIESDAERILLLHMQEGTDQYAIDYAPLGSATAAPALAIGAPFERTLQSSGWQRLPVSPGEGSADGRRSLHVRGGKSALFTDQAGLVSAGADIEIGERGGTLAIEHGAGPLLAWLDRPGEEAADLWATSERPNRLSISLPALAPLEGRLKAFKIDAGRQIMLHVRSSVALVTHLDRSEKTPEVEVHPRGVVLDAYLPKGAAELRLRALGNGALSGQIAVSSTAVVPLDEGLGPEVMLAPGAARLFSFTVQKEGVIGAGVKADADSVEMDILNESGRSIGKGVAQMLRLKPGVYLMKLTVADAAAPVRVQPAVVGLKAPDTGPPPEEIKRYIYGDMEMPAAYSSRRGDGQEGFRSPMYGHPAPARAPHPEFREEPQESEEQPDEQGSQDGEEQ